MRKLLYLTSTLTLLFGIGYFFSRDAEVIFKNDEFASLVAISPSPIPSPIVFVLGGDVMLGRVVNAVHHEKNNFSYAFEKIAPLLRAADFSLFNLESPLLTDCPIIRERTYKFCGDARNIKGLLAAGIDAISFANNHYLDYGKEGVEETSKLLTQAGITPLLEKRPQIISVRNTPVGLAAFNLTWPGTPNEEIIKVASDLAASSSIVIISFHWGEEYRDFPSEEQRTLAHLAIEAGADIIFGHHSHHLQPVERYRDGLIFYSLGNLIFDQMWSEKTRLGALAKILWYPNQPLDFELIPTKIFDYSQPRPLEGEERNTVIRAMISR
jgi:poly-gamma-glutamate synthesis protein (capsule biosynthesis protein)